MLYSQQKEPERTSRGFGVSGKSCALLYAPVCPLQVERLINRLSNESVLDRVKRMISEATKAERQPH